MNENYIELNTVLSNHFDKVNGYDFYKFIFPNNENSGEMNYDYSTPNAVYLYKDDERDKDNKRRLRRRIMLNDTFENDYMEYIECNKALCGGLTYRGRTNKLEHAQQMNALIFDLDNVGRDELMTILYRIYKLPEEHKKIGHSEYGLRVIPEPTFLVISGTGLHFYYVFDTPIDLYPNIKLQLKALKYDLTFKLWEYKATSREKQIQYQSINQTFRMVGSTNEKYGVDLVAYRLGEKITLDELNQYVIHAENQVDVNRPFRPSQYTREEAKEKFPEWYQRVVVEKNYRAKKWDIKSKQGYALYDWWRDKVTQIKGGHRYYYLMCLVIYACKCDVPKDKLKADMYEDFEVLKTIEHTNPLTEEDLNSALETYSKEYYNFKIDDIEKLTDIRIERNKRNYRNQLEHLKRARAVQKIDYPNDEWRNIKGQPTKEHIILEFLETHKDENLSVSAIAKALNISRITVYKYLK